MLAGKRFTKRSCFCKSLWYIIFLCFAIFWIRGCIIIYTRFSPFDDTSLKASFSYVKHRIYNRWNSEAMALYPSDLEIKIKLNLAASTSTTLTTTSSSISNVTNNEFLCAIFLQADLQHLKYLIANMDNIRSGCDWAVIATGGDAALFEKFKKTINVMKNIKIVLYTFAIPRADLFVQAGALDKITNLLRTPLSYNNFSYPISASLRLISPLATSYKYIWLPHSKVDLSHFSFRKFVKSVHCAYYPALGPLLAQPLVKSHKSDSVHVFPRYTHYDVWKAIDDVYAVRTDYIAMQGAPIFQSDFFQWFVHHLSTPTFEAATILGSQYLFDNVACAAAKEYGDKLVSFEKKETTVIPCAIIINSSPIVLHIDNDSSSDQYILDQKFLSMTRTAFPTWFQEAENLNSSPFHNSTIYRRSFRLNHLCLES